MKRATTVLAIELALLLSGCTDSSDACRTTIASVCADGVCTVDGLRLPARRDAWCAAPPSANAGFIEAYSCGSLQQVEGLSGDQGIEIYYDDQGDAYAITRWISAPPCLGACKLICYAGPVGLHPGDLPACALSSGQPVEQCMP
jgi:hypothetical protein